MRHGLYENVQYRSNPCLIPRSIICAQRKAGRRKRALCFLTSQLRFALASMRNNMPNHVKKAAPEWEAGSNPALRTPLRTPHPYTQFPLYLGKVSPYIFSTRLIRTLFVAPKLSVSTFNED